MHCSNSAFEAAKICIMAYGVCQTRENIIALLSNIVVAKKGEIMKIMCMYVTSSFAEGMAKLWRVW